MLIFVAQNFHKSKYFVLNSEQMKDIDINKYNYELPAERIAKYPLKKRDASKLLVYNKGAIEDHIFSELPELLPRHTRMFFNNTKVLYARLPFEKITGAQIEIFCLEPHDPADYSMNLTTRKRCQWKCLVGNLKKWKSGVLKLKGHDKIGLEASMIEKTPEHVVVEFTWKTDFSFAEILEEAGNVPIPPYLNRAAEEEDKSTYQTTYSKIDGSVAAPTAGLHFTPEVFQQLKAQHIPLHEVTLHVSAGTFRPVDHDNVRRHQMHEEYIHVDRATIASLVDNKHNVLAVGTTTVRTLESLYWIGVQILNNKPNQEHFFNVEQWEPYKEVGSSTTQEALKAILEYMDRFKLDYITGNTRIIIVPGYEHRVVDLLLTNFHQPKSTLLLLLASFIGDEWQKMYQHALNNNYRFLSYGDSCLIKL